MIRGAGGWGRAVRESSLNASEPQRGGSAKGQSLGGFIKPSSGCFLFCFFPFQSQSPWLEKADIANNNFTEWEGMLAFANPFTLATGLPWDP